MNKFGFLFIFFSCFLLAKLSASENSDKNATANTAKSTASSDCTILNPYSDSSAAFDQQIGQSFVACQTGTLKSIAVLVDVTTSSGETINVYDGETTNPANLLGSITGQTLTANGGDNTNFDVSDFSAEGINVVSGQSYTFDIPTGANLVFTVNSGYASGKLFLGGAIVDNTATDLAFAVVIEPISIVAATTPAVTSINEIVSPGTPIDLNIAGTLNSATAWHVYSTSCGVDAVTSSASSTISVTPGSGISTYYVRGEGGGTTPSNCGSVTVYSQGTITSTYSGGVWSNGLPNAAYHTVIDDDLIATSEFTSYSLSINSGNILDLNGNNLSVTSDVTIESGGALLDDGLLTTIGGTQTVKRLMSADALADFHLMAVPVSNGDYEDSFQGSYVYRYAGGEYDNVYSFPSGANMVPGEGIAISGNGSPGTTRNYTGTFNKSAVDYTLLSTDEWHLLGNPYPAPLSLSSFYTTNNTTIRPTFYFYNEATGAYDTWNTSLSSGTGSATANASVAQGFFIEELNSSAAQVSYTSSMRINATNTFLKTAQEENAGLLKIQLNTTETLIAWNNISSNDEDINDANYLQGAAKSDMYSLLNGKARTIQAINSDFNATSIPLGFYALEGGINTIAIANLLTSENIEVILIDKYENTTHNLNASAYEFMAEASEEMIDDRFEIVLTKTSLLTNHNETLKNNVLVSGGSALNVMSENKLKTVRVYNIAGALVHETKNINNKHFHWNAKQTNTIYIIEVTTETSTSNHKIILK